MPNETRATRYHRARLQAGAGAFLASLLVLLAFGTLGAGPALSGAAAPPRSRLAAPASWVATVAVRGHRPRRGARGAVSLRSPSRVDAGRPLRSGAAVVGTLDASPPARHRRAGHARHRGGAARDARPGRWRGAPWWLVTAVACYLAHLAWTVAAPLLLLAAFGGLRRAAAAVAGGAARGAGAALRRPRGGARMARRRRDHAGARSARRARPDPPDPALGHAGRHARATRRSRSSSRTRSGTTSTATCGGPRPGDSSRCR